MLLLQQNTIPQGRHIVFSLVLGAFLIAICPQSLVAGQLDLSSRKQALVPFRFQTATIITRFTRPASTETCQDGSAVNLHLSLIADLDRKSGMGREPDRLVHFGYKKTGTLSIYSTCMGKIPSIEWHGDVDNATGENFGNLITGPPVKPNFKNGSRGMELSDLIMFNRNLYACEDRTGIVFRLTDSDEAIPWITLIDTVRLPKGKGFKCEWSVVKDGYLYIGSHSASIKRPHVDGPTVQTGTRKVKKISPFGTVEEIDWNPVYAALETYLNIRPPGFIMLEAVLFSSLHRVWYILPRRIKYSNATEKAFNASAPCNFMVIASANFADFRTVRIGISEDNLFGFSAARFIPDTNDSIIIALRTLEKDLLFGTRVVMFDVNGTVLLTEETVTRGIKFEGLEFT